MDEVEGQNDEWEPKQNVACVVEKSKRMEVFPGIMNNDLIKSNHFAFPDFKNLDVKTESNFAQQKHTNKQQHHQQQQQQQQQGKNFEKKFYTRQFSMLGRVKWK